MCGVIGYVGKSPKASDRIFEGLKKLEYRGYDSCGIALGSKPPSESKDCVEIFRAVGSPDELLKKHLFPSKFGIGHTRWATHGKVCIENAHPHRSHDKKIILVHNGVVENAQALKKKIEDVSLEGDTDSEILANFIAWHYSKVDSPVEALKNSLSEVMGTYGLAIIFTGLPDKIFGAKKGSPLILGIAEEENYLASDTSALPHEVHRVVYLEDNQVVSVEKDKFLIHNIDGASSDFEVEDVSIDDTTGKLEGYSCFMEKEIMQQPESIKNAMLGRIGADLSSVRFGGVNLDRDLTKEIKRVLFLGCGTAYHAGLVGKYAIENLANIPVSVEIASEYKYKNNPTEDGTLAIAISQSGETIDTLAALAEAQNKGLDSMGITNVVSSTIARQAGKGIFQHAGVEVSVASTKAFTSQVTILLMLAVLLGRKKSLNVLDAKKYLSEIEKLPDLVDKVLSNRKKLSAIAEEFKHKKKFIFLGRQSMYPIALEAALKLKEITYLDAQGYAAGEFKHGPLALITDEPLCFYFATQKELLDKNISNIQEIKARQGRIILITQEGIDMPSELFDEKIEIPRCRSFIHPVLSIIPMQLFAMYLCQALNLNPDKPRNLAKSVTVE
tara:strand:+ start:1971 stop:3809 length:1839 start_codon:yes stop_codon:yes gene_type:complete